MLLGLVLATSGTVDLLGRRMPGAARDVLPDVGAIIEDPAAYPHLSGRANLALFDAMDGSGQRSSRARRVDDVLDQVGLGDVDGRPVRAYSLGMRQRLGLANALLRSPRLLVLDEPTNGLDPQGIRDIRALLLELNRAGTTVFVSSHLLAEIEQMCTRVGVLHRGRLVLQDHLDDLQRATGRVLLVTSQPDRAAERLGTRLEERDGRRLLVRADDVADLAAELVAAGRAGRRADPRAPHPRADRAGGDPGGRARDRHRGRGRVGPAADRGCPVIAVELSKLVRNRRTWVTILLIDALPTLVAVLLAVTDIGPRPGAGPAFLSAVMTDGKLFPLAALAIVLPLFLPLAVAITAGEAIAGEAQQGTLRYLLVRPVGRTRLLVAKLVSVMAFVVLTIVVVAATAYVTGALLLGDGEVPGAAAGATTSVSGSGLTTPELVVRTLLALAYAMFCMLGVAAIALFLSTVVRSPLAAALGTMGFLIASTLLLTLDAADSFRGYLPTRYWLAFVDLFRDPIFWRDLLRGVLLQTAYVVVFLAAAWANFATKDVND